MSGLLDWVSRPRLWFKRNFLWRFSLCPWRISAQIGAGLCIGIFSAAFAAFLWSLFSVPEEFDLFSLWLAFALMYGFIIRFYAYPAAKRREFPMLESLFPSVVEAMAQIVSAGFAFSRSFSLLIEWYKNPTFVGADNVNDAVVGLLVKSILLLIVSGVLFHLFVESFFERYESFARFRKNILTSHDVLLSVLSTAPGISRKVNDDQIESVSRAHLISALVELLDRIKTNRQEFYRAVSSNRRKMAMTCSSRVHDALKQAHNTMSTEQGRIKSLTDYEYPGYSAWIAQSLLKLKGFIPEAVLE